MTNRLTFDLDGGVLAVGEVGELLALESRATESDLASVEGISSQSRRAERLSWRALLREVEPLAQVEYCGRKPRILNSKYSQISVSHCVDVVAVMLGDSLCGVDVERTNRDFGRVMSRYMTSAESSLSADEHWPAVVWCAKEALFKMAGREGVDFRRDMEILSVEPSGTAQQQGWMLSARLFDSQVGLRGVALDAEHILVFTL